MNISNITWKDVLVNKGFNKSTADSLIGFISWKEDEIFSKLGQEINDVLNGYEGKVVAKDVISDKHNDKGLLFVNNDLSQEVANSIFNTILDFEHNVVYDYRDLQ